MMSKITLCILLLIVVVDANWLKQRNVLHWQSGVPQEQFRTTKKTFVPPRYSNLWGQGESSKVVDSVSSSSGNIEDYKMNTQQKPVFAWQPSDALVEW